MGWRAIHDDVPISESLTKLSDFAERLYFRMLAVSDTCGRGPGTVPKLAALCVPTLAKAPADVRDALDEIVKADRVLLYCVHGEWAYEIVDFNERQPVHQFKERKSRYPAPPLVDSPVEQMEFSAGSAHKEERREEERKPSAAKPAAKRGRRADPLFDAMVEECGIDKESLTDTGRGAVNRALKAIGDVGADADELRRRATVYRRTFSTPLTAPALAKHWGSLAEVKRVSRAPAPCQACGVGGGMHTADCPSIAEKVA